MHINVGEELVHRNAEVLCGGLDDSDVCLMRDKEVNVVYVKTDFLSSISCGSGKRLCSELVNFLAVLNEESVVNGLVSLIINNRVLSCGERTVLMLILCIKELCACSVSTKPACEQLV